MTTPQTPTQQRDLPLRLHRIEGQVRGTARMIEQDTYCIDVVTHVPSGLSSGAVCGA